MSGLKNSLDLLQRLIMLKLDVTARDPLWWPGSGSFAMVVSAILTQQARYTKVEESLARLRSLGAISPERLAGMDIDTLIDAIRPSGFYRMKAQRIQSLALAIVDEFGDFEDFRTSVERPWLMRQPGIGNETADAILCYGCHREVMVVDAYTERLLQGFDMTFAGYHAIQQWLCEGLCKEAPALLGVKSMPTVYALYHGLIVEYAKDHSAGRQVSVTALSSM